MYIPFMWCCHPLWRKPGYEIDQEAMDAAKTAIRQYMQQRGSAGRWWSDSAVPKSTVKRAGKPHEIFHDDSENPDFFSLRLMLQIPTMDSKKWIPRCFVL
jgi:hypothetical protein